MPLAHLLTPALLRKAQEIEADLGHALPQTTSYLEATAKPKPLTYEAVGGHAPGTAPKYDPDDPRNKFTRMLGGLQHSPNPVDRQIGLTLPGATARAALRQQAKLPNGDTIRQMPIPLAPPPTANGQPIDTRGTPIGYTEGGLPIYGANPLPPKTKGGKQILVLPPRGEPAGLKENGRAIDVRGRQLGYLNQGLPDVDPNFRNPVRRAPVDEQGRGLPGAEHTLRSNPEGISDFDARWLQQLYGDHVKAMQYDRDAGEMRFPEGYFDGKSPSEVNGIMRGVEALQKLQQGVRI